MKFKHLSDEELQKMRTSFIPGKSLFIVKTATEKKSKTGNDMIELLLEVIDNGNHSVLIYDYLVSIDKMLWRIKDFCEAIGKIEKYENDTLLPEDCVNTSGECITKFRKGKDGFKDKFVIQEYCPKGISTLNDKKEDDFFDDDIKF